MFHEVEVSNLMFNKTSSNQIDFKKYDINVDLEEESSNDQKTILKYSLDLTSNPKNAVINISGNTILNGEQSEIEQFLKQEDKKTPEVVSLIYQELFPLMYIISKNMNIPSPAHTISQNNIQTTEEKEIPKGIPIETPPGSTSDDKNQIDEIDQTQNESPDPEIKNILESNVAENHNNEIESS